jgi:hypothetical protein
MSQPSLARSKRFILVGLVALALLSGGLLVWWHSRAPIPAADVEGFLDKTLGGGRVLFSVVRSAELRLDENDLQVSVVATARTLQPLYSQTDTSEYLRQTFQIDPDATAEARRLLADAGSRRGSLPDGLGPVPGNPFDAIILTVGSPAGAPFAYQGVIAAHRDSSGWNLTQISGGYEGPGPLGQPRSTFGDNTFAAGDSGDEARLRSLATDFQSFAGRVAERRRSLDAAKAAEIERRREAFMAQVAPGTVFRGTAVEAGSQIGTPLFLEITELSPDNKITALLRNDGGWSAARVFEGSWTADDDFIRPVLNLSSPLDQAVRNSGPFLENTQVWTLSMGVDPKGGLSGRDSFFEYRFEPLERDQASALKVRLEAELLGSIAATQPDLLYLGTAFSRASGASEPILLRFTGHSNGGKSIEARLESPAHPWRRPLRGSIITNSRRSGGRPIVMRTASSESVADAPPESVMGTADDMEMHLGIEAGSLVGEDAHFRYRLALAGDSDLRRMHAEGEERARRFLGVFRSGIVYDGILHEEQGFRSGARLEIIRIDRRTGSVSARLRSISQPGVFRELVGTCDPASCSLMLAATERGSLGGDDTFDVPLFQSPAASAVHLELAGSSVTGGIEGDSSWVFEFPVGAFLSAPTEGPGGDSPPAYGSVFPEFPKAPGAYLLTRGTWSALPTNLGGVVVEKEGPTSNFQLPTNLSAAVEKGLDEIAKQKQKRKIPYLEFAGTDPRPESSGQAIVVLFVGAPSSGRPALELARAETTKEGKRRVEVLGGPDVKPRFGENRISAYVRQVAPGYIMLTTTPTLDPGPYALIADRGYELIQD